MANNLLISAIPSSGSDWFASCISRASSHSYYREFFNPLCNWPHADKIGTVFGCESAKYSANIMRPAFLGDFEIARIFNNVWVPSGHTMTKEVWVTEKIPALSKHFHVVCFSRTPQNSLPPSRARTVSWFHAVANQLGIAGGFADSAIRAYTFMHESCEQVSSANQIPLVLWEDLVFSGKEKVVEILLKCEMPGVDCRLAAEIILGTRREEPRRKLEGWSIT